LKNIQTVEKVIAEPAFANSLLKVFVGGGDQSDIYFFDCGSSHRADFANIQQA